MLEKIIKQMEEHQTDSAIISNDRIFTYGDLLKSFRAFLNRLDELEIHSPILAVRGEFNVDTIGLMLAAIESRCIYVPIARTISDIDYYLRTAQCEYLYDMEKDTFEKLDYAVEHPLLLQLRKEHSPGLIFFSSGTTGEPKAAVHDIRPFIRRFEEPGKSFRMIAFLLFDHEGGFNTVMQSISNVGTLCTVSDRAPNEVCRIIEKYKVEVLPTSPTFLQMLLLGKYYKRYDLSSLKIISYGTEPMPQIVLTGLNQAFPSVKLKQTYGLTELGVMRTKSRSSDSLWVKIGGDSHYQTKVVDGILYIKSDMAMLGYLNAEAPFDSDGWYNTGDRVETDGEYFLIKGRDSELINVGGQKVYPTEIESVIMGIDGVSDVIVHGTPNAIMGMVVATDIYPQENISREELTDRIKQTCREKLEKYKRPVKINFSDKPFHSERMKKTRRKKT